MRSHGAHAAWATILVPLVTPTNYACSTVLMRGTGCRRFGRGRSHGDIVEAAAGSGGNDAHSLAQHGEFTGRNDR